MHIVFFWSALLGAVAFCLLLLPVGFALCYGTNVADFRSLPSSTRLLWCLPVATPLSVLLAVGLELWLPVQVVAYLWAGLAAVGWLFWLTRPSGAALDSEQSRWVRNAVLLACGLGLYLALAGLPVLYGHQLFESMSMADLAVRVPLVDMAARHGQPVVNPFNTLDGNSAPLRYYYFWYVLTGLIERLLHIPARAAQTASGIWAMLTLLSSGFLLLSSLFRPLRSPWPMRRLCLLTVPVACIIGLDIVWLTAFLLKRPRVLYPDSDYWRSISDFSPSFNLSLLYAPHHVAGLAISFITFLLILPPEDVGLRRAGQGPESTPHRGARALLAGLGLAMLIGTSTYMGLFACVAGLFLLIERLRSGDRPTAAVVLGAAALGLGLAAPFLYQVTHVTAHAQQAAEHHAMFRFSFHAWRMANFIGSSLKDPGGLGVHHWIVLAIRVCLWCALFLTELGFFAIVLWIRLRTDWRARRTLLARQRYQWMLFFAIALPGFFLSTATLAGDNDLSRHAGLALRYFAVLWATPIVAEYLHNRFLRRSLLHTWAGRFALALVVLGLATQLYQIVGQRFYNMASEHLAITEHSRWRKLPHQAAYNYQMFAAYQALDRPDIPAGPVLYNPSHRDGEVSVLNLYQTRYAVAGERHCMTAFGGDVERCEAALPAIYGLFGDHDLQRKDILLDTSQVVKLLPAADTEADMSADAMARVCQQHHASAVIASITDEAWQHPSSFVWHAPVLYSGDQVRLLACPAVPGAGNNNDRRYN